MKSLIISGEKKPDSVIEFTSGLNIIHGPSNTGKSYIVKCIDFLFGSSKNPIDHTTGYDCIKLTIETDNGTISMSRKLDKTNVQVISHNASIPSGKYKLKGEYENTLNFIWLKLIGINEQHKIFKNKDFVKRNLTWRTFSHILLVSEERIITEQSILLPKTATSNTAAISALLFLITGNDFGDITPNEEKKIKKVRVNAVVNYINKELAELANRKGELTDSLALQNVYDFEEEINNIVNEISKTEQLITSAINQSQELLKEIYVINENLSESKSLQNKYQELKSLISK